jgi:hypothetical protein
MTYSCFAAKSISALGTILKENFVRLCGYPENGNAPFSYISKNWRGQPLLTREVVVNLIANTRTTKGLEVQAILDHNEYLPGVEVTEEEIVGLNIVGHKFHPEWNYTISPRQQT